MPRRIETATREARWEIERERDTRVRELIREQSRRESLRRLETARQLEFTEASFRRFMED